MLGNEPNPKELKGMKIGVLNTCMLVAAGILYIGLFCATVVTIEKYEELVFQANRYIELEEKADVIREASDFLSEQVRLYVQNMDLAHAELYFEEANINRRRENTLTELEAYYLDAFKDASAQAAVQSSHALMQREIYAMKLISAAQGYAIEAIPPEIWAMPLEPADAALSADAMIEKARSMMFDEEYQHTKTLIYQNLSNFTDTLLQNTRDEIFSGFGSLLDAIRTQRFLLAGLIVIHLLAFLVLVFLVQKPIRVFLRCVRNQSAFEETAAYEFNYLAQVYNDIYDKNRMISENEAFLRHKAEHDSLTGILNRSVFNQMDMLLEKKKVPLALMIIDVDRFKQINDNYGHEVGDQILKKIAALLEENFRSKDYLFRIGGDEFACVVTDMTPEQAPVIEKKVLKMNTALQKPNDGLPPVSLSVGVAFSVEDYQDELYGQADQALYWVKKHGRAGCHFYGKSGHSAESEGEV